MSDKYSKIIDACCNLLQQYPEAEDARSYLNKRINSNIQEKFKFGYFPPQNQLKLLLHLIDKEELISNNLLYEKNIEYENVLFAMLEQHNLIMPYRDVSGNIVALVGRSLLGEEERAIQRISKYKNTSFPKNQHLFGLFEAKYSILEHQSVYVVEGQFDCIQAHNYGVSNIVALGSSNMSAEQLILLLRYTNNIYLLLDNDEAGDKGRERIMEKFGKYTRFQNVKVPNGFKDLDEFLSEVGTERMDLKEVLK